MKCVFKDISYETYNYGGRPQHIPLGDTAHSSSILVQLDKYKEYDNLKVNIYNMLKLYSLQVLKLVMKTLKNNICRAKQLFKILLEFLGPIRSQSFGMMCLFSGGRGRGRLRTQGDRWVNGSLRF